MTSKSQHEAETALTQNQNNAMSDDPKDGKRESFTASPEPSRAEKKPQQDAQDEATVEDFGKRGMGVAPKE